RNFMFVFTPMHLLKRADAFSFFRDLKLMVILGRRGGDLMTLVKKVLNKDDCPLHYWISPDGKRPWLIFLHGAGTDHHMFEQQIKNLDKSYSILLCDARGHGLSRPMGDDFSIHLLVDDCMAIMSRERIEKATFIGHSMGGNTAQEIAFHYPDKVE